MRCLSIFLVVFFATNFSSATTPPAPNEPDPCYRDKKAPHIKCPDDITVWMDCDEECVEVDCWDAKAWDNCDDHPKIYFDVDRDYCFQEGTTEIWAWAVDKSGNESDKCGFTVTVKQKRDKKAPYIKCPEDIYAYVDCDEKCVEVKFHEPKAWDDCDPYPKVWCEYESGECFKRGKTEVWCWAKDKSGNESKCYFNIIVKERPDEKPPHIECPKDIVLEIPCNSTPPCAKGFFDKPKAWDNCDPHPKVWCNYESGYCFPVGTTVVTCWAKDDSGNESKCSFNVTVKKVDVTPPVITCPYPNGLDLYVDCGLKCSRIMWWMDAMAKDDCDPNPKIWCEVGGRLIDRYYCFPLGATTVTCYAQDNAGNKSSCTYLINVFEKTDIKPPVITCPADIMVMADRVKMCGIANFSVSATDECSVPTVTCDFASGFCFPMGKTKVTCTAKDKAGNTSTCTFTVMVMGGADLVSDGNNYQESVLNKNGKAGKNTGNDVTNSTFNVPASQYITRKEFTIYPNPTNNYVNLELGQYQGKNVAVQVLNSVGQQMYITTLKQVADQPYKIDMQEYPSGMYLIKVMAEGIEPVSKKVMRH